MIVFWETNILYANHYIFRKIFNFAANFLKIFLKVFAIRKINGKKKKKMVNVDFELIETLVSIPKKVVKDYLAEMAAAWTYADCHVSPQVLSFCGKFMVKQNGKKT